MANPVDLKWVDGKAPTFIPTGTSFGIPWNKGEIDKTTPISLSADGNSVPVQTWPDGSVKWTGHTLPAGAGLTDKLTLQTGTPAEPSSPVSVVDSQKTITVTTGNFSAVFNKSGNVLIDSISLSGKAQVSKGTLVVNVQNAPDEAELLGSRPTVKGTTGKVEIVTVEQSGPVRAVIKVTGHYTGDHSPFLPWTVRFYIAAGATALRIVHFFIFDGDQTKDFIKGMGLRFSTPLSDELYNRHIRFVSADGGIWGEPVRVMSGLRRDALAPVLTPQFEGTATSDISTWPTSITPFVDQLAVWSDFTLDQLSSEYFTVAKRSNAGRAATFLPHAGSGTRASGLGCVGGATGGSVVFGLQDFWQGAPRGLDIRDASTNTATVTIWAYSPRAPAMDMRHYDTVPHGLDLAYEDVGDPDPTPVGIGRSYEVSLQLFPATPSRTVLAQLAGILTATPQIVANPSFYADHKLFGGRWNVPDTSRSGMAVIEKRKSDLLDFYVAEIDQRKFYGFWNYGDVMHTYDQTRHTWRYDVGGYAWDNGELGSDLWLWMSFLRTGRADVYRIAYAMTRHISEVDSNHTGPFAGIGNRHNVSHWGDGAKEARVAGATLRRPFYYLTTDELMGDLMDYTLAADQTIMTWDPLRKVFPPPDPAGPGRLRIGPDWTTLAGNWFTKWERTVSDFAWQVITSNTVGVWPAATKVGGTDVLNPINEIVNLATNDAGSLSLSEYAVMAIAPELAPDSFAFISDEEKDWDRSTIAASELGRKENVGESIEADMGRTSNGKRHWKRFLCM
ncbi:hypothetical protein H0H87_005686 [Tephrocybe sp. NHM501043]|nr:hypothetical protein H0H87_005686 [Tephrocybe sp. NHM501043]